MKSFRKVGGDLEECNVLNQNLDVWPQKHFHSWKIRFCCPFLEQGLSTGTEKSITSEWSWLFLPRCIKKAILSSTLTRRPGISFETNHWLKVIPVQWVIDYCSSNQLLLRRNISLCWRSKKILLFEKVRLKWMELIRLLSVESVACTFWKEWLLSSWITILHIWTSLVILLRDELPSVVVFETGKGVLALVSKWILCSYSEQMYCRYTSLCVQPCISDSREKERTERSTANWPKGPVIGMPQLIEKWSLLQLEPKFCLLKVKIEDLTFVYPRLNK